MEIYDEIEAFAIEDGDQIVYNHDVLEVYSHVDETDAIMVHAYSHNSGDMVDYILTPETTVFLWRV